MDVSAKAGKQVERGAAEAAHAVSLRYVGDGEAGILRRRAGRGFCYLCGAARVDDIRTIERIRRLAIPPAWTEVWICLDRTGHIQATGRDQRGRRQYIYHPDWMQMRDEAKFSSLIPFARALPRLRRRIDQDLRERGLPLDRVVAAVVWLLDRTMIRIGNESYARENGSFGLTTLRDRHVDISGSAMRFVFKGKSGKEWRLKLADRRIAGIVRQAQDLPGQQLFQYLDEGGRRLPVTSQAVNAYITDASDPGFTSKHFRTWGATVRALALFAQTPLPDNSARIASVRNQVIDTVAARLGNTRSVCRSGYIHPAVISSWESGQLPAELKASGLSGSSLLDRDERRTLAWLKSVDGGEPAAPDAS